MATNNFEVVNVYHNTTLFLSLAILLLLFLQYLWKRSKLYILSWSLPGPLSIPILGNALIFFCKDEDIFERFSQVINYYPSPMKLWLGPKLFVIIKEAEQIQKVMSSLIFLNKDDDLYRFIKEYSGEGLIPASGLKWKNDRKLLAPLFSNKNITSYFPILLRESNIMLEKLNKLVNTSTFNVEVHVKKCVTEIVCEVLSGTRYYAQDGYVDDFIENLNRAYIIVHARMTKIWLQIEFIFRLTSYWKTQEDTKNIILHFLNNMLIKSEINYRNNLNMNVENCIIHSMLKIKQEISAKEIINHLVTFFTAGEDTITSTCSFALVLLGIYQDIQKNVVNEIHSVLGKTKDKVGISDLHKFVYLEMCIKEILRLFPIGPYIVRVASDDVKLDKVIVPKGCSVMIAIYNIHRDPNYWKKPNEFYPDHFLPTEESKRHPYAYVPFSAGLRGCIGRSFAFMCIKTILITILQHYYIEADGKLQDIKLKADISIRLKENTYPIRIKERIVD